MRAAVDAVSMHHSILVYNACLLIDCSQHDDVVVVDLSQCTGGVGSWVHRLQTVNGACLRRQIRTVKPNIHPGYLKSYLTVTGVI